jgi:hypothetical protein
MKIWIWIYFKFLDKKLEEISYPQIYNTAKNISNKTIHGIKNKLMLAPRSLVVEEH